MEKKISENAVRTNNYKEKPERDLIFSFLKQIELKTVDNLNCDKDSVLNGWKYKIIFKGQQDQVILCPDYAFVGKTIFPVDNKVIEDFQTIQRTSKKEK